MSNSSKPAPEVTLDKAAEGDSINRREIPGTTIKRGWGWVRSYDGTRSVYVVNNPNGVWVVQAVEPSV